MKVLTRFPLTGNSRESFEFSELPFLPERHRWQYVDTFEEAQIILEISDSLNNLESLKTKIIDRLSSNQVLCILGIWHSDNDLFCIPQINQIIHTLKDAGCQQPIFVHTNEQIEDDQHCKIDFMWNRQKLYFTDYKSFTNLDNRTWTLGASERVYKINDLNFTIQRPYKLLSASRIYGPPLWPKHIRMQQRKELQDLILASNQPVYVNNSADNFFFLPNEVNKVLLEKIKGPGTWYPIADSYYNNSYVSAYVETITLNKGVQCTTEKSFDPLIKGHFILPMGNYRYIDLLKSKYGFKFPEWINYEYDNIENDRERFKTYLESVKEVLSTPISKLHELYVKNRDLIEHNRSVFFTRSYDSFYDSLSRCIKRRNYKI